MKGDYMENVENVIEKNMKNVEIVMMKNKKIPV